MPEVDERLTAEQLKDFLGRSEVAIPRSGGCGILPGRLAGHASWSCRLGFLGSVDGGSDQGVAAP